MAVTILKAVVLLLIGFVLLIKGADFFVEGASSVAKALRIPALVIGMTVVAMGTSLPELAVSVTASMTGENALAVSNVVGSNIFNLMVVLGASALISKLDVSREVLRRDFPFSVICAILLAVMGYIGMELNRIDGGIFIALFIAFLLVMIRSALKARSEGTVAVAGAGTSAGAGAETAAVSGNDGDDNHGAVEEEIKSLPMWQSLLYIAGGIIAIKFGGDWVVDGAVDIASIFGLSENLIGLTIVACGTSLPELATSMVAAKKNELDMAVGNVVGSNIFNILLILGVAALMSPVTFIMENVIDIIVLVACSVLVWYMSHTKQQLSRREGILMLVIYAVYLVYICIR